MSRLNVVRRAYSTAKVATSPAPHLRQLMRSVAQPVAIITACIPSSSNAASSSAATTAPEAATPESLQHNHGATLSSLSSISLSPPLVAFSLRLPSRLASYLLAPPSTPSAPPPTIQVHLLGSSTAAESLARAFARQPPLPQAATPSPPPGSISTLAHFAPVLFDELKKEALGSLRCTLVKSIALPELATREEDKDDRTKSELFVVRVDEVELLEGEGPEGDKKRKEMGSLVYWEQGYQGVGRTEA